MMKNTLRVTIITSTKNAMPQLATLANSLREQSMRDFEWLIADGGSKDGTIQFLKSIKDNRLRIVSRSDSGIYDAWNKALAKSRGMFVCFLGADDAFYNEKSLFCLCSAIDGKVNLISSVANIVDNQGRVQRTLGEPWAHEKMRRYQCIAHPGLLIDSALFKKYGGFDIGYKICGDYEWLLRCSKAVRPAFVPKVSVNMGAGGVSESRFIYALSETFRAQRIHNDESLTKSVLHFTVYAIRVLFSKGRRRFVNGFGATKLD